MIAGRPDALPLAVDCSSLTDSGFWIGVGVLAGIYASVALGLQLNVGFTGIVNFGQAGFMAIGGYTMAILTRRQPGSRSGSALPLAMLVAMAFGLLVGLPVAAAARRLLRDRHDRQRRGRAHRRPERPAA